MNFIHSPSVQVIAWSDFLKPTEASTGDWKPRCQNSVHDLIEFGGRGCYRSWSNPAGRTNAEYIKTILDHQHYSVLEHANFTLWITGISRSCSHELVRHRHCSFSQESQRFVPATDLNFVVPPAYIGDEDALQAFEWQCASILGYYQTSLEEMDRRFANHPNATERKKRAREAARAILPNAAETRMSITGNLRTWREVLYKRATAHADAEICRLAIAIYRVLQPCAPAVFQDVSLISADCGREILKFATPPEEL